MEASPAVEYPIDVAALDRIDAMIADAGDRQPVSKRQPAEPAAAATPPVERILEVVEKLLAIRAALDRDAALSAPARVALLGVLRDAAELCDEWGFDTARVRVDFTRDDLRSGSGDIGTDITELIRHIRHDARAWRPARARGERRHAKGRRPLAVAADRSDPRG